MTIVLFVSLFFILLSIVEKLLLSPVETIAAFQFPGWFGLVVITLALTWLLGD